MFIKYFTKDQFKKSSQWVSLTRSAAYAAMHDRIVEPWFATFAGVHWRCAFVEEGQLALDGVAALLRSNVEIASGSSAATLQLRARALLPKNFSTGLALTVSIPYLPGILLSA
jgi:hypothetical protein